MNNLLVWCLAMAGLTLIVTTSKLFARIRDALPHEGPITVRTFLGAMLRCPMCFGFWAGAGATLLGYAPPHVGTGAGAVVLSGCIASLASYTWFVVLAHMGSLKL